MTAVLERPRVGSLFSGIGGLDLAVEAFFGAETAWHCEWDAEPSKVLAERWPGVPNYRDVTKVDWEAVEPVDIMCGGFPCQDVSLAGRRRGMKNGTRSGLWSEFARAIDIVRPSVVVIENVRGLISAQAGSNVEQCPWCLGDGADEYHLRALDAVLADLSDLGFDAEWGGLRASDVGAPHGRYRFFIVAHARGEARRDWPGLRQGGAAGERRGRPEHRGEPDGAPLTLLPTPVVNDMGDGKTVEWWDAWTAKMRDEHGNGNGHGKSLAIEAQRAVLFPTPVTEPDTGNGHARNLGAEVKTLLPTVVTTDAEGSRRHTTTTDASHSGTTLTDVLLPTPRASRGASSTEMMYRLGARRDDTGDAQGNVVGEVAWGEYEPAVRRWETLTRPAPLPTAPDGKNGNHRLSARFTEWLMGYPAGWITDIIRRNPAIRACGNGVVPQQAYAAIEILWARLGVPLEVAA